MASTLKLWKEIKQGRYIVYISELVLVETRRCAEPKKTALANYLKGVSYNVIALDSDIKLLARKYIHEGIIPEKFESDALHIATASVCGCNVLVSWNFQHMVKYKTIVGVNGINKYMGYGELEILPPDSLVGEEE